MKSEIVKSLRKVIKEEISNIISEAEPFVNKKEVPQQNSVKNKVTNVQPNVSQQSKTLAKSVPNEKSAVQKQVTNKPMPNVNTKTDKQKEIDTKRARPEKPTQDSSKIARAQYQIFITKLRMSKLDINDLTSRLLSALHDYDINISKNETDGSKITSYALPAIGAIDALKNVVESLKVEFTKLNNIASSK